MAAESLPLETAVGVAHGKGDPKPGRVADSGIRASGRGRHGKAVAMVTLSLHSNRNLTKTAEAGTKVGVAL